MNNLYSLNYLKNIGVKILGKNIKISKYARIYNPTKLTIYDNVRIDDFTIISGKGNVVLNNYIHIGAGCLLSSSSNIIIDNFSGLSHGVKIFGGSDDYSGEYMTNPTVPKEYLGVLYGDVIINKHCIIGTNSILLPNIELGEGTAVGAQSLINKNTLEWNIYAGNPARKIKKRSKNCKFLSENII